MIFSLLLLLFLFLRWCLITVLVSHVISKEWTVHINCVSSLSIRSLTSFDTSLLHLCCEMLEFHTFRTAYSDYKRTELSCLKCCGYLCWRLCFSDAKVWVSLHSNTYQNVGSRWQLVNCQGDVSRSFVRRCFHHQSFQRSSNTFSVILLFPYLNGNRIKTSMLLSGDSLVFPNFVLLVSVFEREARVKYSS